MKKFIRLHVMALRNQPLRESDRRDRIIKDHRRGRYSPTEKRMRDDEERRYFDCGGTGSSYARSFADSVGA